MNDEPREPLEPEVLPAPIFEETGAPPLPGSGPGSADPRAPMPPVYRPRRRLPLILFLLTCASTFYVGTLQFLQPETKVNPKTGAEFIVVDVDPETGHTTVRIDWRRSMLSGLTYATAVLAILGAHEMGHYLQARRYRVPASLPLFIPMPLRPIGTMGAVIVQQPGVADRKSMFDIAITGPLAGLAVALPLNWWGIAHSRIAPLAGNAEGFTNPRIVEWMIALIHRPLQPGEDILLNPILHAGWVGIFITALNLIPIGQLDGGHILYCLLGKKAHWVAQALFLGAIGFVIYKSLSGHAEYRGWSLMLFLLWLMGTRHPPTANDRVPLGITRIVLGWLTLAFIFVGFVPTPMYETPDKPAAPVHQPKPEQQPKPNEKPKPDETVVITRGADFFPATRCCV